MAHLNQQKQYICINCGHGVRELYKKYSSSIKTVNCDQCHKVADKYIEFEAVIILVDAVLLSEQAFRHILFNRNFKLHWKLSLVLLLLESFALWRKKRNDHYELQYDLVHEKGFYFCCLQNIFDYMIITALLLIIALAKSGNSMPRTSLRSYSLTLLKSVTIANFSKFFLLPIMVWRENTTVFGSSVHHLLVTGHHLFSLVFVYSVVSRFNKLQAALVVMPMYFFKEYLKRNISMYIEEHI